MKRFTFFCCVGALILIPRLTQLMNYPPLIVDEPANVRDIQLLLSPNPPAFYDFEWDFSMAMIVHYPSIIVMKLGIADPYLAIRVTSVLLSILALIPFYLLVRKETDPWIATITTLLLSTNFFFLQFSRVGWTNMFSLTISLYALWCTTIAIDRKSYVWMVIAGCMIGLDFYTYRTGVLGIFGCFLLLLGSLIRTSKRIQSIAMISACIVTAVIIASPWIIHIYTHQDQYTLRQQVVSIWSTPLPFHGKTTRHDVFMYQLYEAVKSWVFMSPGINQDVEANRYMPLPLPMLSYPLIPLLWLGLLAIVRKSKTWTMWILMFSVGLYFGQVLAVNPPNGSRGLILLPIMYMFIAHGLLQIRSWIKKFSLSTTIFFYFFTTEVIILDLYTYIQWMSWIRV